MKANLVAAAAALLAGGVSAGAHHPRQIPHMDLFAKRSLNDSEICVPGCTTVYTTITGPIGLYTPPATVSNISTIASVSSSYVAATTAPVITAPPVAPTPIAYQLPTPGVYTLNATTVVITETQTVCAASTTPVGPGNHTLGGVTTVVETSTTVFCPVATTVPASGGVVTSVIVNTTYVCPTPGTYTIGPIVTSVNASAVIPVPVIATYAPGTYTADTSVVTVVETDYVYYCPLTSAAWSTSTAFPVAASTAAVVVSQAPTTPEAAPSSAAATSSAAKAAATGTSSLGGSGDLWAITYTPYTESGQCKSAFDVLADMKSIKAFGFIVVRVYSTDCDALPNVGSACASVGLKMILGVFINEVGCQDSSESVSSQINDIATWARWDLVDLVVIGNEALYNGYCTVGELTSLISSAKSTLGAAGYTGPYTTTDVVSAWQQHDVSSLCAVIDIVGTNAHAYFNAEALPAAAGVFVAGQLAIVEAICGKQGLVLESGWPSKGNCNGQACAGTSEQAAALASIQEVIGSKTVFFTFGLDMWKDPGSCNCEPWFDCKNYFNNRASRKE